MVNAVWIITGQATGYRILYKTITGQLVWVIVLKEEVDRWRRPILVLDTVFKNETIIKQN